MSILLNDFITRDENRFENISLEFNSTVNESNFHDKSIQFVSIEDCLSF